MRYEELSLPLAGGLFQIRFHQHVTVLAGLTGRERAALVDAFANAAAGQVPGGRLVYRDRSGRRVVVRDGQMNYLDDGTDAGPAMLGIEHRRPRDAHAALRRLRGSGASPARSTTPPGSRCRPSCSAHATSWTAPAGSSRRCTSSVHDATVCWPSSSGPRPRSPTWAATADRYLHNRAHTLVELERVRSALASVEADPGELRA